jgi:Fic family protein
MHPFHDGNGRTARAIEALLLQRSHLKETLFIAMSNYYYDEKNTYLSVLSEVRQKNHDLTSFLRFGLNGITIQCRRLLKEITAHVRKSLFRDVMGKMYGRLQSTRKRALATRQCEILNRLIDRDAPIGYRDLFEIMEKHYLSLAAPFKAYIRDLNQLVLLEAISINLGEGEGNGDKIFISARLEWATEITETAFYKHIHKLPEAKTKLLVSS